MIMAFIAAAMSVIVINLDKKQTPVPLRLKVFCRSSLVRLFCMKSKSRIGVSDVAVTEPVDAKSDNNGPTDSSNNNDSSVQACKECDVTWQDVAMGTDRFFCCAYFSLKVAYFLYFMVQF